MKKIVALLIISIFAITTFARGKDKDKESAVSYISLRYQFSPAAFPEIYEIHMKSKKAHYIEAVISSSSGKAKVKKRRIRRKKWNIISHIIEKLSADSLSSVELSPEYHSKFSCQIYFINGEVKELIIPRDSNTVELLYKLRMLLLPPDTLVVKAMPDFM